MPAPAEMIGKELHTLKKGRGLQDAHVLDDLGPTLIRALGLDLNQTADKRFEALRRGLYDTSAQLPPDYRRVFLLAVAMRPDSLPTLKLRLAIAAKEFKLSDRTIRRRLNEAIDRMAVLLSSRGSYTPYTQPNWETRSLRAELRLDGDRPLLTEHRLIVATVPDLDGLDFRISVPAPSGRDGALPELVAAEGCEIGGMDRESASLWHYRIDLPQRLRLYEEHHYSLRCTLPTFGDLRPYYVVVPFNGGCRTFSASVHFGSPPVAAEAWRLDGIPTSVLEDASPDGRHRYDLTADPVASCSFDDVRPGLCYGVQWRWQAGFLGSTA